MKLVMIGTGYVGLVSGTCFAEMGHSVVCLDVDEKKISKLNLGEVPIYEPGLTELVIKNVKAGRLSFTASYSNALEGCEVCFIAVPTGSNPDGSCDLSFVEAAAQKIGETMNGPLIIVNKSTVPPKTAQFVETTIRSALKDPNLSSQFHVVSNPEFLKEGAAVQDCLKPDRIILGTSSSYAENVMRQLYAPFSMNHDKIVSMSTESAELTKYAANSMLALRISFMNELSAICDHLGANIHEVRKGIGSDHRIGSQFLYAGVGYGGSCFPKDVRALDFLCQKLDLSLPIIHSIELTNQAQQRRFLEKILSHFSNLTNKVFAIWGLSFKPDTDDIREAPALDLIEELLQRGAMIQAFDPISMPHVEKLFPPSEQISYAPTEYAAATKADAIVLMTEWKQFRFVDFEQLGKSMRSKVIFDGRNQYHPKQIEKQGFTYYGIGVH